MPPADIHERWALRDVGFIAYTGILLHQIFKKHIYRPSIGIHASFRGKYLQLFALAGPESTRPATYFPPSCAGVSVFRRVSARLKRATFCAKMFPRQSRNLGQSHLFPSASKITPVDFRIGQSYAVSAQFLFFRFHLFPQLCLTCYVLFTSRKRRTPRP